MITLPLMPVVSLFGSPLTLFDVSHGRDGYGRPSAPIVSPDRNPQPIGIIQPARERTLTWAQAAGLLVTDGAYTLHTTAPIHCVDLTAGAPTVDASRQDLIVGVAPRGAVLVRLTVGAGPAVAIGVDPFTRAWGFVPSSPLALNTVVSAIAENIAGEMGGAVQTRVGAFGASGSGMQTYVRRGAFIFKAWGIGNWSPHQSIARYILTLYRDSDGAII